MSAKNLKHKSVEITKSRNSILRTGILMSFLLLLLTGFLVTAQPLFGDEWINTKQTYLRIPVSQTGFYKITSQELRSGGLPVDEIKAASFQIFRRGKELAIEVETDSSGKLGSIGFYGQRNDGALDTVLYIRPEDMPHKYYSLYSDTAAYFLTWRIDGLPGKRIVKSQTTKRSEALSYHFEETTVLYNGFYSTGSFYPAGSGFDDGTALTAYDTGEGWTGKELNNSWQTIDMNTSDLIPEHADQIDIELVFVGRKAGKHEMEIWTGTPENSGRKINTVHLNDYHPITYNFSLQKEDIDKILLPNGKLAIAIYAKKGTISVSHALWRYPQKSDLSSSGFQKIFHFVKTDYNKVWKAGNTNDWQFYDCSDPYNLSKLHVTESGIENPGTEIIIGVKKPLQINSFRKITFPPFDFLQTDYLIISHPLVRKSVHGIDPVAAYAAYRSAPEGGNYRTHIVNIEEVFDRFNYGEPGPQGITNMIRMLQKAGKMKFIFIIGHSTDPQTARKLTNARSVDMIPNAGWPGSDLALSMNLHSESPYVPLIPIGRINAETPEQVQTYLRKVRTMESQPVSAFWRKNILHLSGGRSISERTAFREYVNSFEKKISNSKLGAHVQTISKQNDVEVEQFPLHIPINKGIALLTLYGHSGIAVSDIDLGYASDENRHYRNGPFYPAVIVNGCALGSIFYSNKTISTDWIFSPDNGAVLFLAHTFNGVSSSLKHYSDSFYNVLADSAFTSEPFGIIQKEAIRRNMLLYPTMSDGITAQQMNLHGDPAIRIFPARLPDYTFDSTSITLSDISGKQLTTWSDSILIRVGILNNGRFRKENYELKIQATDTFSNQFINHTLHQSAAFEDTLYFKLPNPFPNSGETIWDFTLDPANLLLEEDKINNVLSKKFSMPAGGAFPLLPLSGYISNQREIELIAQVPLGRHANQVTFEWDTTGIFTTAQRKTEAVNSFIARHKLIIPDQAKNIFWRIYIPEDANRPSQSRSIFYKPESPEKQNTPEGVAILASTVAPEIQEGDQFRANISFVNVTNFSFQDSISVYIAHLTNEKNEMVVLKTTPLIANTTLNLPLIFSTTGETGLHQVTVKFNYNNLPEEIYSNNEIHFAYNVIPDRIKPVLNVSVDHRQLVDGDYVSSRPTIEIVITDENKFLTRNDTTGIEVWIKEDCLNCRERQISLTDAETSIISPNDVRILLVLKEQLKSNSYQLRVKAKDMSGNQAADYTIHFKISDEAEFINAGISPNPSGDWFRFYVNVKGILPTSKILITIYDLKGHEVKKIPAALHEGKNEWFWHPENLPAGIYFYQIETAMNNSSVINKVKGKLIWLR